MTEKCDVTIPVYIPARQSIYKVPAKDLQRKLDALRNHKDPLFRFFFVLSADEEIVVRKALG
jgi:hypothetical protein